uniref:Uncharacterized protein n=1 Tax=viral metagenome TaxID=1070528 RepID=A0A6C0JGH8_9ZZZZ
MSISSSITFVTAYFKSGTKEKIQTDFEQFRKIADSGIQLCVYVEEAVDTLNTFPNIKIMKPFDSHTKKLFSEIEFSDYSNNDYFVFSNSKYEFMENVILENPWNSSHFSWIDFTIFSIFKKPTESKEYLKCLSKRTLFSDFFAIGGWIKNKNELYDLDLQFKEIRWRFLDKFFIGDKKSVMEWVALSKQYLPRFLRTYKKITSEVNFWNWLETVVDWQPVWFFSIFDDSVIQLPLHLHSMNLKNAKKTVYNYPLIEGPSPFFESSASHLLFQGQHLLNTRFVSYFLLNAGQYYMPHPKQFLITKNQAAILDEDTMLPINYELMDDSTILLENAPYPPGECCNIFGLEDIRLYEFENKIRFIATNRNFAPAYKNRMVIGDYNMKNQSYDNCLLIESPCNSTYEKNWIPITYKNQECFIYNWYPMDICRVNLETQKLELVCRHENTMNVPYFHKVRGSSIFINVSNGTLGELVGVVHFSEDTKPRQYYHMLVSLEKDTFKPLRYSETFYFQHIGVEFCTGFWKNKDEYIFWVSKKDRNTCMITVNVDEIPLCFEFF